MTPNEGIWDRLIRILAGIGLTCAGWLAWPGGASLMSLAGVMSIAFLSIAIIAVATGIIGWCPLYALLGLSTNERLGT